MLFRNALHLSHADFKQYYVTCWFDYGACILLYKIKAIQRTTCKSYALSHMVMLWVLSYYNFPIEQTIEDYAANLNECIIESKFPIVILIDSLDDAIEIDNLNWLPMNLSDKVKLIITTATSSSQIDDVEKCGENDIILWKLRERISKQNYVHLKPFSAHKWDELLTCGGDFFSANAQLRLPEHWKDCNDKIPLQAKVSY